MGLSATRDQSRTGDRAYWRNHALKERTEPPGDGVGQVFGVRQDERDVVAEWSMDAEIPAMTVR
jgi:hypothetical protein